jgi:TM2 domain-containing membrane protein YozV
MQTPAGFAAVKRRIKMERSKASAGIFAILFGSFGVHKFYLGKILQGFVYLLFCWTGIPGFIGLIEGIIYLTISNEKFNTKYNSNKTIDMQD